MMEYVRGLLKKRGVESQFSDEEITDFEYLLMPVDTDISIDKVILSDENKAKLEEFRAEQDHKEALMKYKLMPMNRLLFYGASGTGKTFLTKALSNYMNYAMLYIDIAKALSEGTVAKNIANIFRLGDALGSCFIFLDEADSIAWNRDSTSPDSGTLRRATNSLFQHLDQMNASNVFISATNMLHRLDPAFERRFNMKFEFRRPKDIEESIPRFLFPEFKLVDDADPDKKKIIIGRAENSPKLSYYEIQTIVERAMKKSVMQGTLNVSTAMIYNDIAIAERIKIRFKTDKDIEEEFKSSIT